MPLQELAGARRLARGYCEQAVEIADVLGGDLVKAIGVPALASGLDVAPGNYQPATTHE